MNAYKELAERAEALMDEENADRQYILEALIADIRRLAQGIAPILLDQLEDYCRERL